MSGGRFVAGIVLAGASGLVAVALLIDRLLSPVRDPVIGTAALLLALGFLAGALLVRPVGSRILPLFGIVPALVIALYASWLLDPAPTDIPERANLLFGVGLSWLWITESALRFGRNARSGVIGASLLFVAVVIDIAGATPGNPNRPATAAVVVMAIGLLLVAAWAARLAAWVRTAGPLVEDAPVVSWPGPGRLAWQWARPLPNGIPVLVMLAGVTGVVGALLRFTAFGNVQQPPLALVQAAFGVLWALSVIRIVRAAPNVGRVTSVALVLVELAVPLGLFIPAVVGGLALAGPLIGANPDPAGAAAVVPPAEVVAGALGFVGISIARFAWILLAGGRTVGVLAGLGLVVGAVLVSAGGSSADAGLTDAGRAVQSVAWLIAGAWIVAVGRRLRGAAPLAVFRSPADREGIDDPPIARQATGARRPAPARPAFARQPRTAPRHDVEELARRLGVPAERLRAFRPAYSTFTIPKRSGGTRTITAPLLETKDLQRRILRRVLARLPAHPAAHGFEGGRSIVTNAAVHRDPAVLVKLDIEDFFGATRTARIRRYWRVIGWDREAAAILTRLTTHGGGLPQGAPTSPRLANLVNVRLDARLSGLARTHGARYTRYADDLTFSFSADDGPRVRQLIHAVAGVVRSEGRYRLHLSRKVEIRRRHERQAITGLIVNGGQPRLDRARRRWLRAVEHRHYSGGRATIDAEALRGWHALEAMVERQGSTAGPLPPADARADAGDDPSATDRA